MTNMADATNRSQESQDAFSQVVGDYADFAYNVAFRMLRNTEDAEDASSFAAALSLFSVAFLLAMSRTLPVGSPPVRRSRPKNDVPT